MIFGTLFYTVYLYVFLYGFQGNYGAVGCGSSVKKPRGRVIHRLSYIRQIRKSISPGGSTAVTCKYFPLLFVRYVDVVIFAVSNIIFVIVIVLSVYKCVFSYQNKLRIHE